VTVTTLPRHAAATERPHEHAPRWIPTRAGILNVWRYYDEVFEFHEGRLLLRGPNGSGKSKALELLLPFLFDANLRANRLSTFGTGERTMHWNLMGEGATGVTRVGYVWLEFRLRGEPDRWFTCGARLQASTHSTTVRPDYFTTDLRVGRPDGVALINDAGQPLTTNALQDRLGERGVVHDNATDYRTEIRSTLFPGLNEQRFDALITALLQLRTPKLSQRLDPALLSTLLSRALPPLGQQEIAELAEGFERLDAQREKLTVLDEEVAATRTLAARQQAYARRVLRARAAMVISATTELENRAKAARESAQEYEQVSTQKEAAAQRVRSLGREISDAEARKTGLTESDTYKQGQELDRLRQQTAEASTQATKIRSDASRKRAQADIDEQRARDADQATRRHEESVGARQVEAQQAATRAGMTGVYGELVTGLAAEPARARALLRAAVQGRRGQIDAAGKALDAHGRAVERRQQAEADLDLSRSALSEAGTRLDGATKRRELALTELADRLVEWMSSCRELVFSEPAALLDHIESEARLLESVDLVVAAATNDITRRETVCQSALADARDTRDGVAAEIRRLSTEQDIPPVAPPTRTTHRDTMAGAPLWRLVDFARSVPDRDRAGIEAALEASGLLDAWIGPRGEVEGHDVFAEPDALAPVPGRSLADVLVPEPGANVSPAVVRTLLASVAFGDRLPSDSPAAVGADGSWRLGNLTGSWQKDHPAHVGVLARQRARQRRLRDLRAELADHEASVSTLERELVALTARRDLVSREREARPGHGEVSSATRELTKAESDVEAADGVVRHRIATVSTREQEAAAALYELTRVAAENGVPSDRTALAALAGALDAFRDQAETWLEGHGRLVAARQTAEGLATQARRAVEIAEQREDEAGDAEERHARLVATLEAVDSTFGVDYREVLVEIDRLRNRLRELGTQLGLTNQEVNVLAERRGNLDAQRETDALAHRDAVSNRDVAAQRFRQLAVGVFPSDSGLGDLPRFESTLRASEGVRPTLESARLIAAEWPTVPHAPNNIGDALARLSESVHACRNTLSSRADLDLETDEDVQIFTAVVDGVRVGAAELLAILRTEADQSRNEITDRERELFDQTLTGDTRRQLADRIRQANDLVDGMNARLDRVRTASNVAVHLIWQIAPDLPPGTRAARDLLLKDPVRLTDADRESLHRFFRDRIEKAKADNTATSWEQQLAQVLDYTSWHQFVVKIDRANGAGWQPLTKRLHGALSGGEKAIALHLPLFAAVAAHYQATPTAPRVILLDEVFVGVDSMNRGQVFALLSALDLDLMLTSDHEWCTYAELSGVGIHQLITGTDGDDAVTTARFTWDGRRLTPDEQPG
jgi:uncharacterized protein (TIGR02680 family)